MPRLPSRCVLTNGRTLPVSGTPMMVLPPPAIHGRLYVGGTSIRKIVFAVLSVMSASRIWRS